MKIGNKIVMLAISVLLGVGMLAGCSKAPETNAPPAQEPAGDNQVATDQEEAAPPKGDKELVFMVNIIGSQAELLGELSEEFTKETGVGVEFIAPGAQYEEIMKTKMAANDLPDLFSTHGWSVARYSEYLKPVNDQPWADNISPSIEGLITDKDGNKYVLPVNVDLAGIIYNKDVLDAIGIDVDEIKTWDDFEKALQKVKDAGVTPIHIGGKDNWTIGQFFDYAAPSFYITDAQHNYGEEFKTGSFDWSNWDQIGDMLASWSDNGYLNKDALTADYTASVTAFAQGDAAFGFYPNATIMEVLGMKPDTTMGMMPIPAKYEGDSPTLLGGEHIALGVWKDSQELELAEEFLNFLARPENVSRLASSSGLPAGIKGIEADTGIMQEYYDKYQEIPTVSYFDREFLPSGMWDDLCITGANIIMDSDSVKDASKQMEQSFNDKFEK